MKKKFFVALAFIFTLVISAAAFAAIPGINNSRYIKMYVLSSGNDTPVYTDARLNQRGTSNPYRAYNATIYANDEIWIFAMNDSYALISYPTSSGRRQGYVRTSALTGNNYSQSVRKARRQLTEIYARPGVRYSGSSISNGDDVWTVARQGNYTQVVYPTGSTYKMAWITNSDYDNYIAPEIKEGNGDVNGDGIVDKRDFEMLVDISNSNNPQYIPNGDLNGDGVIDIVDVSWFNAALNGLRDTPKLGPLNQNRNVKINLNVGLLKQNDSRWGNEPIRTRTIAARGCTITSLAMIYNYHQHANITPIQMRDSLKFDGNNVIWSSVRNLGFATDIVDGRPAPNNTWLGKIYNQLKAGKPVIVGAYRDGDNQHWVVVKGYTGNSTTNFNAADFQINDPMNPFNNLQQFFNKYNRGLRGIVY